MGFKECNGHLNLQGRLTFLLYKKKNPDTNRIYYVHIKSYVAIRIIYRHTFAYLGKLRFSFAN